MSDPLFANIELHAGRLPQNGVARSLVRAAVISCGNVLFLAAVVLWSRRAVGAISAPLPGAALLALGFAVSATAMAARYVWRYTGASQRSGFAVSGLFSISVVAIAAAASMPGSTVIGIGGLWLIVVVEELWSWWPRRSVGSVEVERVSVRRSQPVHGMDGQRQFELAVSDSVLGAEVAQEHVTQQVTRLVEPDGTERVVGWMRVSFEPGQRLASVHLAFCPPFIRVPEASLERLEGPPVRIKRVQVFPYGARFDLKLASPAEETTKVLLQVAAEALGGSSEGQGVEPSHNPKHEIRNMRQT